MINKYHHVTIRLVPNDETPVDSSVQNASLFIQAAFRFDLSRAVCQLAQNVKKDESLGHLFKDVPRPTDGVYRFEIATELPYYLPDIKGKPEYTVNVKGTEIFVCNRMIRAFFGPGFPKEEGHTYFLLHRRGLKSLLEQNKISGLYPIPLKSFISRKYELNANTAEEAIELSFLSWREEFIAQISYLVDILRAADPKQGKHLFSHPAVASFGMFWIIAIGDSNSIGCEQFAGEVTQAMLRPAQNLEGKSYDHFSTLLKANQSIPSHEAALSLAHTYSHYGYNELAVVQICVACETILSKALRQYLGAKGISNNYLKEYLEEVTFSSLLNIHLASMCDLTKIDNYQDILGNLNWARKRRNEIVHEGQSTEKITSARLNQTIEALNKLIDHISAITY